MSIARSLATYGSLVKLSHTVFALPFALAAVVLASRYAPITPLKVALIVRVHRRRAHRGDGVQPPGRSRHRRQEPAHAGPRDAARRAQRGVRARCWCSRRRAVFVAGAALLGRLPLMLSPLALGAGARLLVHEALHRAVPRGAGPGGRVRARRRVDRDRARR